MTLENKISNSWFYIIVLLGCLLPMPAQAVVVGTITTVAGTGVAGSGQNGNAGISARLDQPISVTVDNSGNIYIVEKAYHTIRKVDATTGFISWVAGVRSTQGGYSGDGSTATSAALNSPTDVAVDGLGNLYIADRRNHRIRKVDALSGIITTVAGTGVLGFSGDGGAATSAQLNYPEGVAIDGLGNLYIADTWNQRIRKVDALTGTISTVAGSLGVYGFFSGDGGPATSARLKNPKRVVVDGGGNIYIADQGNQRIRKVDAVTGLISTFAGSGTPSQFGGFSGDGGSATLAQLSNPLGISLDGAGNLYIADQGNGRIRKVVAATGTITTVAGSGAWAYVADGVLAHLAPMSAWGVSVDNVGNIYIADADNYRVRKVNVATGLISTAVGVGIQGYRGDTSAIATGAQLNTPNAVAVDSTGNLYIADTKNHRIERVDVVTGLIRTIAGVAGSFGYSGDGGPAAAALLRFPQGVAIDKLGNIYVADTGNHSIRRIDAVTGFISTVVGTGVFGFSGDAGFAVKAKLKTPKGVAVDQKGNIYIADSGNHRIRRVDALSGIISTIAGKTGRGYSGDGGLSTLARLNLPQSVAVDSAGNVYFTDTRNNRIRKVDVQTRKISTVAGNGRGAYSGGNGVATAVSLFIPKGILVDASGNLYISDTGNHQVRKVDVLTGRMSTIVGMGTAGYSVGVNIVPGITPSNTPIGLAMDRAGSLYIAAALNHRVRKVVIGAHAPMPIVEAINTAFGAGGNSWIFPNDPNIWDTHSYAVTTGALHGTGRVSAGGLASYTPNTGFSGADSFVVTVTDNGGLSDTVTVNVRVARPINLPPVPGAPIIYTAFGASGTSQVAAHDPNVGDTHSYAVTTGALHGIGRVSAGGLASYTPNTGFSGADSFVVTVTDNGGLSGTVTVNVRVARPINLPPVPGAPIIYTAFGASGTSQVAAHDPNVRDTHSYAVTTGALHGIGRVSAGGLASYTPNTGFSGADSFVVTVTDNGGLSGTVTVQVTVAAAAAANNTLLGINLGDVNGNGSADFAVLGKRKSTGRYVIRVKDVNAVPALIREISLNGAYKPVQMVRLPDVNGNGSPEIAVLEVDPVSGLNRQIQVKDGRTGAKIVNIPLKPSVKPHMLVALPDVNGNGSADLALSEVDAITGKNVQIQVKDGLTGALIRNIRVSTSVKPHMLVSLGLINGAPALALSEVHATTGKNVQIQVKNALTGAKIVNIRVKGSVKPHMLVVLPDVNGNGSPDIALSEVDAVTGKNIQIQVKDGKTGALIRNIRVNTSVKPHKLVSVGNINGAPALALSEVHATTGKVVQIQVKNARTGAKIRNVAVNRNYKPSDLIVLADINGNGAPELALLEVNATTGKNVQIQVKDALSGAKVRNISMNPNYTPWGMATAPDSNGNGVAEIGLLEVNAAGNVQVQVKDPLTGAKVVNLLFPKF